MLKRRRNKMFKKFLSSEFNAVQTLKLVLIIGALVWIVAKVEQIIRLLILISKCS